MPSGIYVRTLEARRNIGLSGKGRIPWNKGKRCPQIGLPQRGVSKPQCGRSGKAHWAFGRIGELNPRFGIVASLETRHKQKIKKLRENNARWIHGVPESYQTLHDRVRMLYGKPDCCENPNCTSRSIKYEWSNIDHKYDSLARDKWQRLCHSCHVVFDNTHNNRRRFYEDE